MCSPQDTAYTGLNTYFWSFFALWPVMVPLAGLLLALSVQSSERQPEQHITKRASASCFLWRDYDSRVLYWEVVDMARKLILTALILFVDTAEGSTRMLRLVIAAIILAMYLALLAVVRPCKRGDDLHRACLSNLLLNCCFVSGFAIKLCDDGAWKEQTCESLIGTADSCCATEFVVVLTIIMLVVWVVVMLGKGIAAITAPVVRLTVSTGREPFLELPAP
eukprot:469002-Rhodomonas_salina.3